MPPKRKLAKKRKADVQLVEEEMTKEAKLDGSNKKQNKLTFDDVLPSRKYWIMKSEPNERFVKRVDVSFGISDLMAEDKQTAEWEGVRNNEAKNNLKEMQEGDLAFFYHSSCRDPGIAGIVEIVKSAYPDQTQFNVDSPYYDQRSKKQDPLWFSVDVKLIRKFNDILTLAELRKHWDSLQGMILFARKRLSIQPIAKHHFDYILELDMNSPVDKSPPAD